MRPALPIEHDDIVALLARAFAEEPFWRWITRGEAERRAHFAELAVHHVAVPHGMVLVAPALTCAALVVEPGVLPHSPLRALPQLGGVARSTGPRRLPVAVRALWRVERRHPDTPHLTLLALGVDPEHQSLGLGSAALGAVASRADARGLPLYLETSTPRARGLYHRHGYVDRDELALPGDGPPLWTMLRPVGG